MSEFPSQIPQGLLDLIARTNPQVMNAIRQNHKLTFLSDVLEGLSWAMGVFGIMFLGSLAGLIGSLAADQGWWYSIFWKIIIVAVFLEIASVFFQSWLMNYYNRVQSQIIEDCLTEQVIQILMERRDNEEEESIPPSE